MRGQQSFFHKEKKSFRETIRGFGLRMGQRMGLWYDNWTLIKQYYSLPENGITAVMHKTRKDNLVWRSKNRGYYTTRNTQPNNSNK